MKIKIISLVILFVILLSACGNIDGESLNGTSWELVVINNRHPIEGSTITISFKDGQVSGSSGCNSFSGEYQVRGKKIEFGMMMSTLMACVDPAMMEQETAFMQYFGNTQRFELVDGQLQFFGSGDEALMFIPR